MPSLRRNSDWKTCLFSNRYGILRLAGYEPKGYTGLSTITSDSSSGQEKEQCQVLENQMLQVALGKRRQSLEEKQQQQIWELRQHLQYSHELALQQAHQETQAERQMVTLWKELAEEQGAGVQQHEQRYMQEMQQRCAELQIHLTQVGQQLHQETEERAAVQQQLSAGHAQQEVKLAELELRCTQLEQEAEGVKGIGEKIRIATPPTPTFAWQVGDEPLAMSTDQIDQLFKVDDPWVQQPQPLLLQAANPASLRSPLSPPRKPMSIGLTIS